MPQTASPAYCRRALQRGIRRVTFAALLVSLLVAFIPMGMGWLALWGLTHPRCAAGGNPAAYGLNTEEVRISMRTGAEHAGYFFPGSNGATIIVPPAYASGRGGLLHEVVILVDAGYSVLTYDSRQCAGLAIHSLGIWETEDIADALDYLKTRQDVNLTRIGLHGFSQAGASNLLVASRLPEVRAVVAEGGYLDYGAQTLGFGQEQGPLMTLFSTGARLGYYMTTGLPLEALRITEDHEASLPPVLLVYGQHELTLPGARDAAERNPQIALWAVPEATHGSYIASAGVDTYADYVVGFFNAVLLGEEDFL